MRNEALHKEEDADKGNAPPSGSANGEGYFGAIEDGLACVVQGEPLVLHAADAGDQGHDDDLALDLVRATTSSDGL